ncbi:MAG: hypothetical protein JWO43_531 [Candidatus Adlerbacteria bacterium]|nr:hypothetical protein [Candidatus Adlerbacteria bacterium]
MTEVVHADIFFFITAVAVMVLSVLLGVALYYVIGIVREVRAVMIQVRHASENITRDIDALRANLKSEGQRGKAIVDLVLGFISHKLHVPVQRKKPATRVKVSTAEPVSEDQ